MYRKVMTSLQLISQILRQIKMFNRNTCKGKSLNRSDISISVTFLLWFLYYFFQIYRNGDRKAIRTDTTRPVPAILFYSKTLII